MGETKMAGEWIKLRTNLWNDPRVSQLCDLTDSPEAMVVGGLYWLWATADEHTETGLMPGLSTGAVDRKTGIRGFGAALVSIGWVEDGPDGITLARFDEHNGASAKSRAQGAKRQANLRNNGQVTEPSRDSNAPTVTGALPREEKRREEQLPLVQPEGLTLDETLSKKSQPSDADVEAAKWLFGCNVRVNPTARPPNFGTWARDVRLMREIDGHSHRQICELYQWAKADKFWSANIQSPGKLREKWDQLTEKRVVSLPAPEPKMKDWI